MLYVRQKLIYVDLMQLLTRIGQKLTDT